MKESSDRLTEIELEILSIYRQAVASKDQDLAESIERWAMAYPDDPEIVKTLLDTRG